MKSMVFIDSEIGAQDHQIHDLGALKVDGTLFHSASESELCTFLDDCEVICGHNIIHHDLTYLKKVASLNRIMVDTLYLSPLLFPKHPYHSLCKNDKLQVDELNNPVNDCMKAQQLFYDEVNAFLALPDEIKQIYFGLLHNQKEFTGFFHVLELEMNEENLELLIRKNYFGKICENCSLEPFINNQPTTLAYALALISANDTHSITPPWLVKNIPEIENVLKLLRNTTCGECEYCHTKLDIHQNLHHYFGYDQFRTYDGEPLQEKATQAAVNNKSLLAVFPTGGGKSITFQLPALIASESVRGLTVVISPLQSLMKDQVDQLNQKGITEAVTINGMMDPIERANALERAENGSAGLLYISPEQLRSKTIERILLHRNVVRFVIDEAHCFSAWGQDFRVDYLYIGDFIHEYQLKKKNGKRIPVSCFTATAKQKVITDICDYFKQKLNLELELYASNATRKNLHYTVLYKETNEEKYQALRDLIEKKNCPTIVYVSRTRRTHELASKLTSDGFKAKAFNGKMESKEKIENQEAFLRNEIQIIVATSAFGMGVDKKDVKLVIHYDISSSLEDYVQEAGRAGRDPSLEAECFVLYNDNDLDKHFVLLNQSKLSMSEIQQVYRAIKNLTHSRKKICCSPLEIAKEAGWDESGIDIETRVKTAISALETAGYIRRGKNMPRVFATSIRAKNMEEASLQIDGSPLFSDTQKLNSKRIIKSLISSRSIANAQDDDAESRVDYLADQLALTKEEVISNINLMRQEGILSDHQDMSAYLQTSDTELKSSRILEKYRKLEVFLLSYLKEETIWNLKEINEAAQNKGIESNIKMIRTLLYFMRINNLIMKREKVGTSYVEVFPLLSTERMKNKVEQRIELCEFILHSLFQKSLMIQSNNKDEKLVHFSLVGLFNEYEQEPKINLYNEKITLHQIEDALLYLSKIGAMKLEGGFLVLYQGMEIERCIQDNRIKYKNEDYHLLNEFYQQKIRQVHIVGEYANLMVKNYDAALEFVQDYFQMDFKRFISKYFQGNRANEIERNITTQKYKELFEQLSERQHQIIDDDQSQMIVVAAGPGSGKTRVLVHKLASLLLLEDVKHEQLLMLTFSRAAATEFKKRLIQLIGNAANFIEIKTFHSYCFDLLGKMGNIEDSQDVVKKATELIENGEVELGRITKKVLVIDEAQDMDQYEYQLVQALLKRNEDLRIIAVGDDDQNIYEFRGSNSKYFASWINKNAKFYELTDNYRSDKKIVEFANQFVDRIQNRMKKAKIQSISKNNGNVVVTRHSCKNMETAIIQQIIETWKGESACLLTNTNDEALQCLGLLQKNKIPAKLIQSLDGFKIINVAEIRYFLNQINRNLQSPVISSNVWEKAKEKLFNTYAQSENLDWIKVLLRDFEFCSIQKYYTDFLEFLNESKLEDFIHQNGSILVSTIHKSKGKEFDSVYMMLNGNVANDEEDKRVLYVGITRAKKNLYLHTNTNLFDSCKIEGVLVQNDHRAYDEVNEIVFQTSLKDVVLNDFIGKKDLIFKLIAGQSLSIQDDTIYARINHRSVRIARLSKAMQDQLFRFSKKGYKISRANVSFVVAWHKEDEKEEHAILLTRIVLCK